MAHVYRALYRLPISMNLLRFSCGYTSQKLLARQLSALLGYLARMTSKKQQQKRSKSAAPWPLSPLYYPVLHRGTDAKHLQTDVVQARASLPEALLPSHKAVYDEAKRASPRCFQVNPRATMPIKLSNTRLSNSGVPPSECV